MTKKKKNNPKVFSTRHIVWSYCRQHVVKKKKKVFFFSVLKCFHSGRKNNFGLDIACLWKQPLLTLAFVVRRAVPCTLKGYTVFSFVHSAFFSYFFFFLSSILLFFVRDVLRAAVLHFMLFQRFFFFFVPFRQVNTEPVAAAAQKAAAGRL